jgi:lysophospholipase L1-like esterase
MVSGWLGLTAVWAADEKPLVLRNGDMSAGTDVPASWSGNWTGRGKIAVSRDTKDFKGQAGSLKVASVDGPAFGQAGQTIEGGTNRSFTLSGWVKSQGTIKANVLIQCMDDKWKPTHTEQAKFVQNNTDWTEFSKQVKLPDNFVRFNVVLLIDGDGTAWLDEVKLTGDAVKNESVPEYLTQPPATQDPTVPMHGYFKDYPPAWMNFHTGFVAQAKQGKAELVFLGDSITQGWGNQKELWSEKYAPRKAINFGIGGDRTQQLLWRIEHGTLDGLSPKVVVLKIGVNNLWNDVNTHGPDKVAAGVGKVVATIRAKCPTTKVLVLGILPTGEKPEHGLRATIKKINAKSAELDDGKTVRFLDLGDKFLQPDGSISKDIMPDFLHLSAKGYRIWADAMEPLLSEMLK